MVEITLLYSGDQRVTAVHGPSGAQVLTDAPVDNGGKGESYSPTDLVATALGSCMLTYVGKVAEQHDWDVRGTVVTVKKEMVADPLRRIGRLTVDIQLNQHFDEKALKMFTNAVTTCPVKLSISDQIEVPITLRVPEQPQQ